MHLFFAAWATKDCPPDEHPLAREDGGWYPGKPFDPTDVLTDPTNWHVWKQFLWFTGCILTIPVGMFIVFEWILRRIFGWPHASSQTLGALLGVVALQIFMFTYVRRAMHEEQTEFAEQARQEIEKRRAVAVESEPPTEASDGIEKRITEGLRQRTEEEEPTVDDNKIEGKKNV